ncbi:MAG: TRAP transporter large permease subunit [Saprospiraceae bacterium]|nr:TRAP transporter large permease subunit [Saprospiraceae bacterium]
MEILAVILFVLIFVLILKGYPVAFTLGGVSVLFGLALMIFAPDYFRFQDFRLLANRFMGTINNYVLIAIPLFIYMGIMLEKSGLAEALLETMASLFGRMPGGLAISVVIVGALLAASTGIVGATVVTMGLISLPTMVKRGYDKSLASGVVASSGTLGIIIPPSIMLVLLADTINSSNRSASMVDVGSMFGAALLPGLVLVGAYVAYIAIRALLQRDVAPALTQEEIAAFRGPGFTKRVVRAFVLPFALIVAVLGSIFAGVASPTEAAAVGALGATILTLLNGSFSWKTLKQVGEETTHITSMVFMILLGATTFGLMFRHLGGDAYLVDLITQSDLPAMGFLALVMIIIFVAGFFIDFIEIIFIIVPVVTPLFNAYDMDMLWVGILIALNLQTSFLTPPFGFSLFYLKGVAPPGIRTQDIYRGVIPFIVIQLVLIAVVVIYPQFIHLIF